VCADLGGWAVSREPIEETAQCSKTLPGVQRQQGAANPAEVSIQSEIIFSIKTRSIGRTEMELSKYPRAIESQELEVHELETKAGILKAAIVEAESEIDAQIAFDESLKNEAQRKAKRWELVKANPKLQQLRDELAETEYNAEIAAIRCRRLQAVFSLQKLEKREAIARIEAESRLAY
jgi:hypothetical protein